MRNRAPPLVTAILLVICTSLQTVRVADPVDNATAVTCLRSGAIDPASIAVCLIAAQTAREIEKWRSDSCLGRDNEVRRAARWFDRNVIRRVREVIFGKY